MKKTMLFSSLIALSLNTQAQAPDGHGPNLVPNPGFEKLAGKMPKDDVDGSKIFKHNVVNWFSPTETTPDLKISLPSQAKRARKAGKNIDVPHGGIKMAAILTHNPSSERSDTYREYLQVKLDKPTKKGSEYYFEFWVCRARLSDFVSNNIGLVLSPTKLTEEGWKPLLNIKPDYNIKEVINANGRKWERISGTFTSANRSYYLAIGNFFNNEQTKMVPSKDKANLGPDEQMFANSYYLIDDVMLCELNYVEEPPVVEEPIIEEPTLANEKIGVGKVIQLDRVFFESAKWNLLSESNEQLDQLVELMNKYPSMEIAIHGHTDSRGGSSYNQNLSENRTKSVFEYLESQGIAADRMKYEGFGEAKPIADNKTADGRQMNRRVEFVVTKLDDKNTEVEQANEVKPYTDRQ